MPLFFFILEFLAKLINIRNSENEKTKCLLNFKCISLRYKIPCYLPCIRHAELDASIWKCEFKLKTKDKTEDRVWELCASGIFKAE